MDIDRQVNDYLDSIAQPKQDDMRWLHDAIRGLAPDARLWFFDGRDDSGKVVSNPSIGYGLLERRHADGSTRPFYQVGISANASGLTVYLMGVDDKTYLQTRYAATIGKATLTSYCIKLKALKQVDRATLMDAIRDGFSGAGN